MTTQTIALLGGVLVLLLLLIAVRRRRRKAQDAPAPGRGADVVHDVSVPSPAAMSGPARLFAAEGLSQAAPAPASVAPAQPVAAAEVVVPQSWSAGEIVREPGWLMPGEVDNVWQADFAAAGSIPAGAVNGVGRANGHGAVAPDMGALVEGAVAAFDPAAGWGGGALTVELERPEPGDEPRIPQWDPVDHLPEVSVPAEDALSDLAMPAWSEEALVGWDADAAPEADVEAWAAPVEAAVVEPVVSEPVAAEEPSAWPAANWAFEIPAVPAVEAEVADPVVAWWDQVDPAAPQDVPADAGTGRFALGGFALQPGHEAISGVTFRAPLPVAPTGWAVDPADGVAPGTLVLSVDGAVNTGAEEIAVLMEEGFAPSTEGFTVRAAARAAGPFAVSGTFRVS